MIYLSCKSEDPEEAAVIQNKDLPNDHLANAFAFLARKLLARVT
jgi:hypothetical protein